MALPPGGFIMLAFLIVGKRLIDQKLAQRKVSTIVPTTDLAEESS
jgi:electron transport complex protein RnfE